MIDFDALVLAPCLAAFGEDQGANPITFTPVIGDAIEGLPGIFDAAQVSVRPDRSGVLVTARNPVLGCRAADFGASLPVRNDQFRIRGEDYRVVEVQPDGQGHLLIQLMRAP